MWAPNLAMELMEGDACNYIKSQYSFGDERVNYKQDYDFVKYPKTCGIDFKYNGVGCLTIFTCYNGVSHYL